VWPGIYPAILTTDTGPNCREARRFTPMSGPSPDASRTACSEGHQRIAKRVLLVGHERGQRIATTSARGSRGSGRKEKIHEVMKPRRLIGRHRAHLRNHGAKIDGPELDRLSSGHGPMNMSIVGVPSKEKERRL